MIKSASLSRSMLIVALIFTLIGGSIPGCNQPSESHLDSTGMSESSIEADSGLVGDAASIRSGISGTATSENWAESVASADVSILFLGNSHTRPIPALLEEMYADYQSDKKVFFQMANGFGFLDEQAQSEKILDEITKYKWDYVVLQAQKYSTTGQYDYPTDGAVKLAKLATENGSQVILYPEFPRQGVDEYGRIRSKHEEIAEKADVIIAPIGEAWRLAEDRVDSASLYSPDGNHASRIGYQVVASVIFVITAESEVSSQQKDNAHLIDIAREAVSDM